MTSPSSIIAAALGLICGFGVGMSDVIIPERPLTIECTNFGIDNNADVAAFVLNCTSETGTVQIQIPEVQQATNIPAQIDLATGEETDGP